MKLIKAVLLGMNYSVEDMLQQEGVDSIDDLTTDISDYDYMDIGLVDAETNKLIYSIDNIHGHPNDYIDGYLKALRDNDIEYTLEEKVVDAKTLNTDD